MSDAYTCAETDVRSDGTDPTSYFGVCGKHGWVGESRILEGQAHADVETHRRASETARRYPMRSWTSADIRRTS